MKGLLVLLSCYILVSAQVCTSPTYTFLTPPNVLAALNTRLGAGNVLFLNTDPAVANWANPATTITATPTTGGCGSCGIDMNGAWEFNAYQQDFFTANIDFRAATQSSVSICAFVSPFAQHLNQTNFGLNKIQVVGHDNGGGDRGFGIGISGSANDNYLLQASSSTLDTAVRAQVDKWIFVCSVYQTPAGPSYAYVGSTNTIYTTTGAPQEQTTAPFANDFLTVGATHLAQAGSTPNLLPVLFYNGLVDNILITRTALTLADMQFYRNFYDDDGDGLNNCIDKCRGLVSTNSDIDSDGIGDECDKCPRKNSQNQDDADSDGVGDVCDNCPSRPNPLQQDYNSDGIGDACDLACNDTDSDGVCFGVDNCRLVPNANQADVDSDGVGDVCDNCMRVRNPNQFDMDSDGLGDDCDTCKAKADPTNTDTDQDGVGDVCDNCRLAVNPTQEDTDNDTVGNACDNCVQRANTNQSDVDSDGIGDVCDNCPRNNNPTQVDTNSNGIGDVCEICTDPDSDGVCNETGTGRPGPDNCPTVANPNQADADKDGLGDVCDKCPNKASTNNTDWDSDGVGDICDGCPFVPNPTQVDSDSDGVQDACDNCPGVANANQSKTICPTCSWGDACVPGAVQLYTLCNKVWLVNNTKNITINFRWDWRPSRWTGPRMNGTVAPLSYTWIVLDAHSASKQTVFFWENSTTATPVPYQNMAPHKECIDVIPTCRGRYKLISKISQPIPLQWETPLYAFAGNPSASVLSSQRLLAPGEITWITTTGTLKRERLIVWIAYPTNQRLRKEYSVLNRWRWQCPGSLTLTGP